jgi:hypothetical protein
VGCINQVPNQLMNLTTNNAGAGEAANGLLIAMAAI